MVLLVRKRKGTDYEGGGGRGTYGTFGGKRADIAGEKTLF